MVIALFLDAPYWYYTLSIMRGEEGKALAAGKYSLYSIPGEKEWTIIINKTWKQSGTQYNEADDALRVTVKPVKSPVFVEKMMFVISPAGKVSLSWGGIMVPFNVK